MDTQKNVFKEEAYELLAELETSLLELEESPDDMELIGRVFRAMHTIKGSGAMFGFDDVANFTHNVETVFDKVREGAIVVTKELIDLTLSARDHIRDLLDGSKAEGEIDPEKGEALIAELKKLMPDTEPEEEILPGKALPEAEPESPEVTFRIRFKPSRDIFANGTNPLLLLNELREMGECAVTAYTSQLPPLETLNPEECHIFWDIVLTTRKTLNAVKDVFIFVEDDCQISIKEVFDHEANAEDMTVDKLGEILVSRGDISKEDLHQALEKQAPSKLGQILVKENKTSLSAVKSALVEQECIQKKVTQKKEQIAEKSVRVPAEKLDHLIDLVGELVTVQARLSQKASTQGEADLVSIAEEVEMLTSGLRDNAMSIRMLQIGTTFSNFKRLVRDLSDDLGKKIELTTSGGETELDKTVIERLKDPLVHIIRNSIDHGIEMPEARKEAGKPETGTIHLSARHSGAYVLIRISDDGKGLDPVALRNKAEEKGILSSETELTEKEILNIIFAPGFSTAETVTDVSGRGVGMDVVKKSIDELRGSIEIDSKKFKGTSITLKLPLTLAIIDGLLVTVGEGYFVLPLASVEECVELPKEEASRDRKRQILNVRGEIVPYVKLRDEYDIRTDAPALEQVVIMEANGKRTGFVVDNVIGGHQTVIKNLGSAFRDVGDISGATILGDGTVALIVDVNKIIAA
jgi:two-component system chemotaxis sensor kinase CheA